MPVVRFAWNPQLLAVRREACPRARWNNQARAWTMTATEAEAFVVAGHHQPRTTTFRHLLLDHAAARRD